jgi:hypothetical protein
MDSTIRPDESARAWAAVGEAELSAVCGGFTEGGCVPTSADFLKLIFHGLGLPQA